MFDYRSKDGDWGNSKDAIERSVEFLTSRKVTVKAKSEGKTDERYYKEEASTWLRHLTAVRLSGGKEGG